MQEERTIPDGVLEKIANVVVTATNAQETDGMDIYLSTAEGEYGVIHVGKNSVFTFDPLSYAEYTCRTQGLLACEGIDNEGTIHGSKTAKKS